MERTPLYKSLYFQVLVAIALGVVFGALDPAHAAAMKPLGDGFVKLIRMIIAPVIFCTVVHGIAGTESLKRVGKTGGYALLYFEVVSTLSLIIGLIVVNTLQPGAGMNVDASTIDTKSISAYTGPGKLTTTTDFILNVIPVSFFDAFAKGEILQVLLLAILVGIALQHLGGRENVIFQITERFADVLFKIVAIIMRLAPAGAFGAMAFTVGNYGLRSLLSLAKLMGSFYLTCFAFVFLVLGAIARAHGFSIFKFVAYIKEEILIVLGTSSSEPALPRMMAKIEALGAGRSTVGLVIPTG